MSQQTFFTADLHFWHSKMAQHRGFAGDAPAMNAALRDDWNKAVGDKDVVYVLGDVSFAGFLKTVEAMRQLNGHIHVVPGNHDDSSLLRRLLETGIIDKIEQPLMDLKLQSATGEPLRFALCHFPLLVWNRAHYGAMHLHGHSHGQLRYPAPIGHGRILDVGVDATKPRTGHLGPISLTQVLDIMSRREYTAVDQHNEKAA